MLGLPAIHSFYHVTVQSKSSADNALRCVRCKQQAESDVSIFSTGVTIAGQDAAAEQNRNRARGGHPLSLLAADTVLGKQQHSYPSADRFPKQLIRSSASALSWSPASSSLLCRLLLLLLLLLQHKHTVDRLLATVLRLNITTVAFSVMFEYTIQWVS